MRARASGWMVGVGITWLLTSIGCGGDGLERIAVSGSVSYKDQPVVDGQIRFTPKSGTAGPVVIEAISDGHFTTMTKGGMLVGDYLVEIRSYDPNTPWPQGPGDKPRPQLLPLKYNRNSELELVVESGQKTMTKDFTLTP